MSYLDPQPTPSAPGPPLSPQEFWIQVSDEKLGSIVGQDSLVSQQRSMTSTFFSSRLQSGDMDKTIAYLQEWIRDVEGFVNAANTKDRVANLRPLISPSPFKLPSCAGYKECAMELKTALSDAPDSNTFVKEMSAHPSGREILSGGRKRLEAYEKAAAFLDSIVSKLKGLLVVPQQKVTEKIEVILHVDRALMAMDESLSDAVEYEMSDNEITQSVENLFCMVVTDAASLFKPASPTFDENTVARVESLAGTHALCERMPTLSPSRTACDAFHALLAKGKQIAIIKPGLSISAMAKDKLEEMNAVLRAVDLAVIESMVKDHAAMKALTTWIQSKREGVVGKQIHERIAATLGDEARQYAQKVKDTVLHGVLIMADSSTESLEKKVWVY